MLADNVRGLRIDEALFVPSGGYRSTLGTLKHIAGWSHVYRSYAFERQPKHWAQIDWPRGLRETVESRRRDSGSTEMMVRHHHWEGWGSDRPEPPAAPLRRWTGSGGP